MRIRLLIMVSLLSLLLWTSTRDANARANTQANTQTNTSAEVSEGAYAVIFIGGWTSQNSTADADALSGFSALEQAITTDTRLAGLVEAGDIKVFPYSGDYQLVPTLRRDSVATEQASSGANEFAANMQGWSNTLSTMVEELPNKRIVIVAHSIGGVIATYWAATAPESLVGQVELIVTLSSPLQGTDWGALARVTEIEALSAIHPMLQIAQMAAQRVNLFTIRNQDDWVVPAVEASMGGVWKDMTGPYSFLPSNNPSGFIEQLLQLDESEQLQEDVARLAQEILASHGSLLSNDTVIGAIVNAMAEVTGSTGTDDEVGADEPSTDIVTGTVSADAARFVGHVTLAPSVVVTPGQTLEKVWRVQNTGVTIWEDGYQLVFQSGAHLGAAREVNLPRTQPQEVADIGVSLQLPADLANGSYRSVWRLRNPKGILFGPQLSLLLRVQADGESTDQPGVLPSDQPGDYTTTQIITDFESWGTWERSVEEWGTFTQSKEDSYRGSASGKLAYDFPVVENSFVVFLRTIPILGQPTALQIWVNGDNSGNYLNAWLEDRTGQLWQFTFGRIQHSGWQQMTAPLDTTLGWPNERIDGNGAAKLTFPVQLHALVLDNDAGSTKAAGAVLVDDLTAVRPRRAGEGPVTLIVVEPPTPKTFCPRVPPLSANDTLLTDFEEWGAWTRGDQEWGEFVQSNEILSGGQYAGKLTYDFPRVSDNFVVFRHDFPMAGTPTNLRMHVYGDGSKNFVNAWLEDADGHLWQFTFGRLEHSGWKEMVAPINIKSGWPNGSLDEPPASELRFPLRFYALVVDSANDAPIEGTIYVDDLYASSATVQMVDCTPR